MAASKKGLFGKTPPDEILLEKNSLVLVVFELRFPELSALVGEEKRAEFAMRVASRYPEAQSYTEQLLTFDPDGASLTQSHRQVNRFVSHSGQLVLSLTGTSLELRCAEYTSRSVFLEEVRHAVDSLFEVTEVHRLEHCGVRYYNALGPEYRDDLPTLIRPEFLGGMENPHGTARSKQSMHQEYFELGGNRVLVSQSGLAEAGARVDFVDGPLPSDVWMLDIDVQENCGSGECAVDTESILSTAHELADAAHQYFRWVMTDVFVERFGGHVEG